MKKVKYLALFVAATMPLFAADTQDSAGADSAVNATAQPATAVNLSPAVTEVIRLSSGGVGDDVVLAYIQNSQSPFNLTADDVLYLKDVGLSSTNITAMLNRDAVLRNSQTATTTQPAPTTMTNETAPTEIVQDAPADVTYFYNDLVPYGTWVNLAGFGWCWQPRAAVINHSWKPYCDSGHWVYTDAGWFWQSDYSWGWAPFHYGRWAHHDRAGWVWAPDRVWAPAWVVWRSSGDDCGWAPIPPHAVLDARAGWRYNGVTVGVNFDFGLRPEHFTFVAMHDFADRDLRRHLLPPTEVKSVYQRTTIINNYTVNNRTVINQGIPLQKVAAASRTPIPRATVQNAPAGGRTVAGTRTSGGQPVVYRHDVKPPSAPVKVVAQKVDDSHPTIQHPITPGPVQHVTAGGTAGTTTTSTGPGRTLQTPRGAQTTPNPSVSGSRNTQPNTTFGTTTRPSGQGNQPQRPGSSYTAPSSTPGNTQPGYPTRSSDQNRQPRSGTSTQSDQNRPGMTTTTTRYIDEGRQPTRSTSSYQPSGAQNSTLPTRSTTSEPSRSQHPESPSQSQTKVPQGGLPPRPSDSARPSQSQSSSSPTQPAYRPAPSTQPTGGNQQSGGQQRRPDQP
jgi:hypothetical protein